MDKINVSLKFSKIQKLINNQIKILNDSLLDVDI